MGCKTIYKDKYIVTRGRGIFSLKILYINVLLLIFNLIILYKTRKLMKTSRRNCKSEGFIFSSGYIAAGLEKVPHSPELFPQAF